MIREPFAKKQVINSRTAQAMNKGAAVPSLRAVLLISEGTAKQEAVLAISQEHKAEVLLLTESKAHQKTTQRGRLLIQTQPARQGAA
jgi:hypothetical protein